MGQDRCSARSPHRKTRQVLTLGGFFTSVAQKQFPFGNRPNYGRLPVGKGQAAAGFNAVCAEAFATLAAGFFAAGFLAAGFLLTFFLQQLF